jgi:hypothetical protein
MAKPRLKEDKVGQSTEPEAVEQRDLEFEKAKAKLEKARNEAADRARFDAGLLRHYELAALENERKVNHVIDALAKSESLSIPDASRRELAELWAGDLARLEANLPLRSLNEPAGEERAAARVSEAKKELELPEKAPELYKDRPRDLQTGRLETIPVFLERVWTPWIEAGVLTRPDFRRLDPEGEQALRNWIQGNTLPPHLNLPKKTELVNRKLAEFSDEKIKEIRSLIYTVDARDRRNNRAI